MSAPIAFPLVTPGQVIQVEDVGEVVAIRLGDAQPITGVQIPGGGSGGARRLDDLIDVDGATDALEGQTLVRQADGQWRPSSVPGGGDESGPGSYLHEQITPATVWLINHDLQFNPSGIQVRDHVGDPHYPVASWPNGFTVRLDFDYDVRGIARLS